MSPSRDDAAPGRRLGPSRWRVPRSLVFIVAVCAAAYLPLLLGVLLGAWPIDGDAMAQFGTWRAFARHSLAQGIIPLWNPHLFCGMPFVGNGQSALFYPPNVVYWIFPERFAVLLDAFGHTALMAGGLYHLARILGVSRPAAFIAAVAMALGTDVAAHLGAGHMSGHDARAYIGWNLWALLLLLRTGRLRYAVASAVLLVLQFGAGYPPVTLMTSELCAAMAGAWLVTRLWRRRREPGLPVLPPRWPRALPVMLTLCVALAGVYVLPMRETSKLSVHGDGLHYDEAVMTSGTLKTFVRAAAPDAFGGDSEWQWSQRLNPHEEAGYVGIVALVLALCAPLLARYEAGRCYPAAVPWLGFLLLTSMLLVLGENTPVYKFLFDHLAMMRLTRIPARWMEAWSLGAALLAAFAFEGCRRRVLAGESLEVPRRLVVVLLAVAAAGVIGAIVTAVIPPTSPLWMRTAQQYLDPAEAAQQIVRATRLYQKAILAAVLMSVLAGLGASFFAKWIGADGAMRLRRERMVVGLIALDVLAFFWASQRLVAPADVAIKIRWAPAFAERYKAGDRWVTHFNDERAVNQGMLGGIDIFNGYDPLAGRRFFNYANYLEGQRFWSALYQPTHYSPLLRVAAVSQCVESKASPLRRDAAISPIAKTVGDWQLAGQPAAWPRSYLSTDVRAVAGATAQLAALETLGAARPGTLPVVVDTGTLKVQPAAGSAGSVRESARGLNMVRYDISASHPAVFVEADALYPGWQAWCNRQQLQLQPANYLFRGAVVPKGQSQITMVFNSNTYRFALFLTLIGGTALLVMLIARHRRQ